MKYYISYDMATIYTREPGVPLRRARRERGYIGFFPSQEGAQAEYGDKLARYEAINNATPGEAVVFKGQVLAANDGDEMPEIHVNVIENPSAGDF